MWFIENPWPPIAFCAALATFLLFQWWATHRGLFLAGIVLLLGLSVGLYFVEQAVVTEAERIEANVLLLADAVVDGDVERALSFLSPRADKMRARITAALALYDIGDDMRITDLHVRMTAENSIGISHFRANGTIVGKASSLGGRGATRWQLTWQREAGEWKITEVVRLHPLRDDETLDMFDRPN